MMTKQAMDPPARAGRNEWLLVAFTITTNLADAVTRIALPLLALQVTDSPALVATVGVLLSLPWLLTALHVGVLVDRLNRRGLMLSAETLRLVGVGALLAALPFGLTSLPLIYAVALLLGVAEVVAMTATAAIVPTAVPRHRWSVANVRITAMEYLCNGFVGAPVGGFLVAAGFTIALGATGLTYAVGLLLLASLVGDFTVRPRRTDPVNGTEHDGSPDSAPAGRPERRSMHREIADGLTFLWQHRLLRTMSWLIAVMAGCWGAWLAIVPAYAVSGPLNLDERQFGLLMTALGAGGVAGAALVGPVNRLIGRRWAMFVDVVGSTLLVAVPAVVPEGPQAAVPVAVAAFAAGLGGTMWTVNARLIVQSVVPNDLLGRYTAASRLVGWGSTPVAALLAGVLAETVGYRLAFGFFAVLCAALVVPFLREITPRALAPVDGPAEPAADADLAVTR